jgi:hypothetical protein
MGNSLGRRIIGQDVTLSPPSEPWIPISPPSPSLPTPASIIHPPLVVVNDSLPFSQRISSNQSNDSSNPSVPSPPQVEHRYCFNSNVTPLLRTDSYNLNTPISPSQQQFFRQAHLQHQRRHQHALFQRHKQFLNHQRSTSRKTKRYRTFVHTAARGIGTSTPNDFDYILFLLFQGGLLRYGPDAFEKRNRTLIIRSAELTSVHKLGFQFWNQYSDVDAVFVRRILLAINTQETNRLARQQTQ